MTHPKGSDRPSLSLVLGEARAFFELGAFYYYRLLMQHFPKGDGHPVLVLPGFMASDFSTYPLRSLLKSLGYKAQGWGLGRNVRFNEQREAAMHDLLVRTFEKHGQKVSLVGWSLGGVFAREIAKAHPDCVRSVISLGSPITGEVHETNASTLFMAINGKPTERELERYAQLNSPPPVPTTSAFSKTDGVVNWRHSLQKAHPQTENIEVPASHLGLGVNPFVMYVIADRLSQAEGAWQPFKMAGLKRFFYKNPLADEMANPVSPKV